MESYSNSMYLCIHVLQVVPVSCINRDDTGAPKTCIYGGTNRMRVSSQCWKRAVRMYLKEKYGDRGIRTKFISKIISDRLVSEGNCDVNYAVPFVNKWLSKAKITSEKDNAKNTSAFFSNEQIEGLYDILQKRCQQEVSNSNLENENIIINKLLEAVKSNPSLSELLFGRMFANNQNLNYDAACQVAHAFSVNEVHEESDYYTVVGDYRGEEAHSGSDYLDTKLFDSGVLYRFADVNLSKGSELRDQSFNIDVAEAVRQFLEAFVLSMPTGSVNAYANLTLPENVIVELRDDIPVSFAPAFTKAIENVDICQDAMIKMLLYEDKISRLYGTPVCKWTLGDGDVSFKELCEQVKEEINRRL